MADTDFRERIDERSPGVWGFGPQGGRASMVFMIDDADLDDENIKSILGSVEEPDAQSRDGRLYRRLPMRHPRWPWMFASRIESGSGLGAPEQRDAIIEEEETPSLLDGFAAYPESQLQVLFEPRPYAVLPDSAIASGNTVSWTDETGTAQENEYAPEWLRYVSYSVKPRSELLTANQGQMVFRQSDSTTAVSYGSGSPHLVPYPGHPRMRIAYTHYRITWHQVPLRYVESSNSWITKLTGRINFRDWWGFGQGSLLYESADVSDPYVPAVPGRFKLSRATDYSSFKLVDVTFNLMHVNRTNGGTVPSTISSANWIAAGWNLQPWAKDQKFYYATAAVVPGQSDVATGWTPTFPSAPFELLFTDPDL